MNDVEFKQPTIPSLVKDGNMVMDMHFHTAYSLDAISKVEEVIKYAKKLGIGVAVTDHNAIKGSIKAIQNREKIPVIPGIEVTCKEGTHCLLYFYSADELEDFYKKELDHWIKENPFFVGYETSDLLERTKDYNCVVCAPHPYSPGATGIMHREVSSRMMSIIKAVEVINGYNMRSMNVLALNMAKTNNKAMTGGTDGHTTPELGKTVTYCDASDVDSFIESVAKKKTSVIGQEESIFEKAVLAVIKEETYISRAHHEQRALQLIESQFETEVHYLREKFGHAYHQLLQNHHRNHP